MATRIHPTALIEERVEIGDGSFRGGERRPDTVHVADEVRLDEVQDAVQPAVIGHRLCPANHRHGPIDVLRLPERFDTESESEQAC